MRSVLLTQEPNWQTSQTLPTGNIQSWLTEQQSLTQRLRSIYGNGVSVTVLDQAWRVPFLSESHVLNLRPQRVCLVREVLLHIDNTPLILARTVIPRTSLKINHHLTHLGSRPLGEVIFAYPTLKRVVSETTLIKPCLWTDHAQQLAHIQQLVWGRRTVYEINYKQLLVSEFFLPELLS